MEKAGGGLGPPPVRPYGTHFPIAWRFLISHRDDLSQPATILTWIGSIPEGPRMHIHRPRTESCRRPYLMRDP
jgi:hypothetical protein